jgi:hypothetical protein
MTKSWRLLNLGTPLAVDIHKTMKMHRSAMITWLICFLVLRPAYFWKTKMGAKVMPELQTLASCCGGYSNMAAFARGIKDFVRDIRKIVSCRINP